MGWKEVLGIAPHKDELLCDLTVRNLTASKLSIDVALASRSIGTSIELSTAAKREELVVQAFTIASANREVNGSTAVTQLALPDGLTLTSGDLNATTTNSTGLAHIGNGRQKITPIYDPVNRFLTLFEAPVLSCWMKDFRDDTSLAALSIPGTHNSPTYHWALPSVRCQAVSPMEQLQNGVRFFDIRVQPHGQDDLYLVHGAFPISLTGPKKLRQLLVDVETFLAANPSETLIISLKREGTGRATDQQLADMLETYYAKSWFTEPRIPALGEVRGKIILMRRFALSDRLKGEHNSKGWGLDAESWQDNTPNCVHGQVDVQDFYEVLNTQLISRKIEVSCAQFERSGAVICPVPGAVQTPSPEQIYLNFLTASNFFNPRCWPEKIAAKLNPAVTSFLCEKHACDQDSSGDGGLGIVVCDWVGKHGNWDLVHCIVGMNARRLFRERGYGWNGPVQQI